MSLKQEFLKILKQLDSEIDELNSERFKEDLPSLGKLKITVLGQFSLFLNEHCFNNLPLALTVDFDAMIKGDWILKREFKSKLKKIGFIYDELSNEIWIPKNSNYDTIYESKNILVKSIQPIYCLLSKAIKAPDKNKILIKEAKILFKNELSNLIKDYNGK